MKKQMFSLALTAVVLSAALAIGVIAQATMVRAKIPFKFNVGESLMPDGSYTIERRSGPNPLVLIRSVGSGKSAYALSLGRHSSREQKSTRLVFRRYGDQYFLGQIWTRGEADGITFAVSSAEKKLSNSHLAKNLAMNAGAFEEVTVMVD